MKKTIRMLALFGLLISVVISATPSALAQAELITNGGFETGDLSNWDGFGAVTDVYSHSGSYGVALHAFYIEQTFSPAVTATGDLTFCWYDRLGGIPDSDLLLVWIRYEGDWEETTETGVVVYDGVNPTEWLKYTAAVDTSRAVTGIRIGRFMEGHTYIDDVSLLGEPELPPAPYVVSSDDTGTEQNTFELTEDVYCYAGNLPASTDVRIYVVANKDVWNDGDGLTDVSGGYETELTGIDGSIANTKIWSATLTEGDYDIVVDTNGNGEWNIGEPIDSEVDVGFTAVPEFTTIAIPVAAVLGFVFLFSRRRKKTE